MKRLCVHFVVVLTLSYSALIAGWSLWDDAFANAFASEVGNRFAEEDEIRIIRIERITDQDWKDIEIGIGVRKTMRLPPEKGQEGYRVAVGKKILVRGNLSSKYTGYLPSVFLFALILASPVPWRRRFLALLAGSFGIYLFVLFRVWLDVQVIADRILEDGERLFPFEGLLASIFARLRPLISDEPSTAFLLPITLWAPLTIRPSDLARWVRSENEASG